MWPWIGSDPCGQTRPIIFSTCQNTYTKTATRATMNSLMQDSMEVRVMGVGKWLGRVSRYPETIRQGKSGAAAVSARNPG